MHVQTLCEYIHVHVLNFNVQVYVHIIKCKKGKGCVKAGSQYNASAAYRHLPSPDDDTKQNAVLALYCEPGLTYNYMYNTIHIVYLSLSLDMDFDQYEEKKYGYKYTN